MNIKDMETNDKQKAQQENISNADQTVLAGQVGDAPNLSKVDVPYLTNQGLTTQAKRDVIRVKTASPSKQMKLQHVNDSENLDGGPTFQ